MDFGEYGVHDSSKWRRKWTLKVELEQLKQALEMARVNMYIASIICVIYIFNCLLDSQPSENLGSGPML
jgi:hypothetical protein